MSNFTKINIFLTGFMGSGKSTIGKRLGLRLGVKFIDTDEQIESDVGMEIRQMFATEGETWFRKIEEDTVASIISHHHTNIISLGGGTLLSPTTVERILTNGKLIYIKSDPVEIWNRIKHSTRRPLLRHDGEEWSREIYLKRMEVLMQEREPGYLQAHLILDRDGKEVDGIVDEIILNLEEGG